MSYYHYNLRPVGFRQKLAAYIQRKRNGEGFTLIELAIVLVIIAAFVGGAIQVSYFINAANIRTIIAEQEKAKVAFNTFKLKYDCLAGDCPKAQQLFGQNIGNGDGDGKIRGAFNVLYNGIEWRGQEEAVIFWKEMALAGLIDGEYLTRSANRLVYPYKYNSYDGIGVDVYGEKGDTGMSTKAREGAGYVILPARDATNYKDLVTGNHIFRLGNICDFSPSAVCAAISADNARSLDEKIDDGKPGTGKVEARGATTKDFKSYNCHNNNAMQTDTLKNTAVYLTGTEDGCTLWFYVD